MTRLKSLESKGIDFINSDVYGGAPNETQCTHIETTEAGTYCDERYKVYNERGVMVKSGERIVPCEK